MTKYSVILITLATCGYTVKCIHRSAQLVVLPPLILGYDDLYDDDQVLRFQDSDVQRVGQEAINAVRERLQGKRTITDTEENLRASPLSPDYKAVTDDEPMTLNEYRVNKKVFNPADETTPQAGTVQRNCTDAEAKAVEQNSVVPETVFKADAGEQNHEENLAASDTAAREVATEINAKENPTTQETITEAGPAENNAEQNPTTSETATEAEPAESNSEEYPTKTTTEAEPDESNAEENPIEITTELDAAEYITEENPTTTNTVSSNPESVERRRAEEALFIEPDFLKSIFPAAEAERNSELTYYIGNSEVQTESIGAPISEDNLYTTVNNPSLEYTSIVRHRPSRVIRKNFMVKPVKKIYNGQEWLLRKPIRKEVYQPKPDDYQREKRVSEREMVNPEVPHSSPRSKVIFKGEFTLPDGMGGELRGEAGCARGGVWRVPPAAPAPPPPPPLPPPLAPPLVLPPRPPPPPPPLPQNPLLALDDTSTGVIRSNPIYTEEDEQEVIIIVDSQPAGEGGEAPRPRRAPSTSSGYGSGGGSHGKTSPQIPKKVFGETISSWSVPKAACPGSDSEKTEGSQTDSEGSPDCTLSRSLKDDIRRCVGGCRWEHDVTEVVEAAVRGAGGLTAARARLHAALVALQSPGLPRGPTLPYCGPGVRPGDVTMMPKNSEMSLLAASALFTLDRAADEALTRRLANMERRRRRCRCALSIGMLLLLAITVGAVELFISRGKRLFGAVLR